jgi:hypothetical protein
MMPGIIFPFAQPNFYRYNSCGSKQKTAYEYL